MRTPASCDVAAFNPAFVFFIMWLCGQVCDWPLVTLIDRLPITSSIICLLRFTSTFLLLLLRSQFCRHIFVLHISMQRLVSQYRLSLAFFPTKSPANINRHFIMFPTMIVSTQNSFICASIFRLLPLFASARVCAYVPAHGRVRA